MHIEITYCQGNIPTSENDATRRKNRQQKNGHIENVATMTQAEIVKCAESAFIAG
ncbi:hypothetical protein [Pseudomonas frederiksbergensis]|uniref:hypothetical protein n=1 Tax=Pseudomonas frederiksbergensis TaxID=104087 RepID=UPI0013747798|nr:hypothetical protein [Pseudomonas frederiksbergensis]